MRSVLSAACVALVALASFAVHASPANLRVQYSELVVFGDSLSDNGNGSYRLTNKTWPADPAYFK